MTTSQAWIATVVTLAVVALFAQHLAVSLALLALLAGIAR